MRSSEDWERVVRPALEQAISYSDEQPPNWPAVQWLIERIYHFLGVCAADPYTAIQPRDLRRELGSILTELRQSPRKQISDDLKAVWMTIILQEPWCARPLSDGAASGRPR